MEDFKIDYKASTMNYYVNLSNKIVAEKIDVRSDLNKLLAMIEFLTASEKDIDWKALYMVSLW